MNSSFILTIQNGKELQKALKEMPEVILKNAQEAVKKSAKDISRAIVKEIDDKGINDTGKLSQSVTVTPGTLSATVSVDSKYGIDIEGGTRPHGVPLAVLEAYGKRKYGKAGLGFLIQRKIKRFGTKAQPFFKPAIDKTAKTVQDNFNDILKDT